MKIKLFTHNDLDGIGCSILAQLSFPVVDVEYCNYDNVNDKVKKFLNEEDVLEYDRVFITDISVNDEVAELIDKIIISDIGDKLFPIFTLIDHHPSALHLNEKLWANVIIEDNHGKCSGTYLFYKLLGNIFNESLFENEQKYNVAYYGLTSNIITEFVELVRQYDTWEWKTRYNNEKARQLNDLFYIYGIKEFIDNIIIKAKGFENELINSEDNFILKLEEDKKQRYFKSREKEIHNLEINQYFAGVVFAEQYISELGNYLSEKYTEYDFIILIDNGSNKISYRTVKDNIDLGKFAKQFGGGGHPKASGSQIDNKLQRDYINSLFIK